MPYRQFLQRCGWLTFQSTLLQAMRLQHSAFRQTLLRQHLRLCPKPRQLARLMLIVIGW